MPAGRPRRRREHRFGRRRTVPATDRHRPVGAEARVRRLPDRALRGRRCGARLGAGRAPIGALGRGARPL